MHVSICISTTYIKFLGTEVKYYQNDTELFIFKTILTVKDKNK